MKYFKYLLLLIALFPLSTLALEEEVIINCPDNIIKEKEFKCEVIGNAPYKVSAIEYEFKLPSYLEKKKFEVDPSWEGGEEDNLIILYTDENKGSPFKIGVITLVSSKDIDYVDISTEYLLYGDDDYNSYVIKERGNVKDVESVEEKVDKNKNKNSIYVIIIMIIVVLCLLAILFALIKRKRVRR